jgi:hypothetical protein
MEPKFVKIKLTKRPHNSLGSAIQFVQIFITNAKKCSWIFVLFIHKKPILVMLS